MIFQNLFKKKKIKKETEDSKPKNETLSAIFSAQNNSNEKQYSDVISKINEINFQKGPPTPVNIDGVAMDSQCSSSIKSQFQIGNTTAYAAPLALLDWFGAQGFLGFQVLAILSQHWLINKACLMPAEDAERNGYDVTVNNDEAISPDIIDAIRQADKKYNISKNLIEFVNMGRVYGIRLAWFKVESTDPKYYEKPFNIDGVTPNSYKGISQIDPYWTAPELGFMDSSNAGAINFYEPTWWNIQGQRVHRSHFVIMRNGFLPDILKPTYLYGSVSVPQQIYERVYAAERMANEAPLLSLTKRTSVLNVDMTQAIANQSALEARERMGQFFRDNYGTRYIDMDDKYQQFDISLADLDSVIMTQYQIVAAIAGVPAVKLLGTSPKGFNASGTYEESSYHEKLKSIQSMNMSPLLNRHHQLLIKSYIAPKFGIDTFSTTVVWKPLNSVTAEQQALLNKTKAETDLIISNTGGIDGGDIRNRLKQDPDSGYNGLEEMEEDNDFELENNQPGIESYGREKY